MRIPTITQFQIQIDSITKQNENIAKLQAQTASQVKLENSSDDPVLAGQIKLVNDYIQQLTSFQNSGILAQNRSELFSSSMENASEVMTKIRELVQSGQSGTLNNHDRMNIANEMSVYLDRLLDIANTKDGSGKYIYSGFNTDVPGYALQNGSYQYQGSLDQTTVATSPTTQMIYNESGINVFGSMYEGNGTFSVAAGSSNTGTANASPGVIADITAYVPDTFTLSFVTNSSGQLAYQVIGATSGQVIPPLPATVPANAPAYVVNAEINFNGMSTQISGQPNVGDTYVLAPSAKQNVFNTVQDLINSLQTPINNSVDLANFYQNMTQASASLEQASESMRGYLSQVGARGADIDAQININNSTVTQQRIILGNLSDIDPYQVTSALSQQLTALQIAQEVYLKIEATFSQLLKI